MKNLREKNNMELDQLEPLLKILLKIDLKIVKRELYLSKSDFLECKKKLDDVRVSEFITLGMFYNMFYCNIFI